MEQPIDRIRARAGVVIAGLLGLAAPHAASCTNEYSDLGLGASTASGGSAAMGTGTSTGVATGGASSGGSGSGAGPVGGAGGSGECPPGLGDCNADPSDGCEQDLSDDVAHCGACDHPCSSTEVNNESCSGGLCDSTCKGGFGNCTMPAAPADDDGCETKFGTDPLHCGSCANSCPAGFKCMGSLCECDGDASCLLGGTCTSGGTCECPLGGDQCATGETCVEDQGSTFCGCNGANIGCSSACCNPGGCTELDSDDAHCGACGKACDSDQECISGACEDT